MLAPVAVGLDFDLIVKFLNRNLHPNLVSESEPTAAIFRDPLPIKHQSVPVAIMNPQSLLVDRRICL